MSRSPARRLGFAAGSALLVTVSLAALVPPALEPGTTYEFSVRTQSTQSGNRESVVMSGRGTYAGGNAKIEIQNMQGGEQSEGMFGSAGSYFIVLDGGQKMLLVDPAKKTYMEWDLQSMMAGMSRVMGALGGLVRMEMTDVKIEAQEMGPGGTVSGHATQHVRVTEKYSVSARVMGRTSNSRVESTTDYYFAPALSSLANPFVQNSQMFAAMGEMFNNADYQRQMQAIQPKLKGVPVKTVTHSVTTNPDGKQETSVTTMEMTGFQSVDVPASAFAVPSGFQAVEMPRFDIDTDAAARAGTEGQSLGEAAREGAAEGAREATKDAAKEATKGAVKGAIGGLRGRIKK